jgi:beta-glucanase (GH16 family)
MSYKNPTGAKYDEDYHTFGVLWEPQLVIWYIDGKEIKRLSGVQVGRQQMNIVTYLVTGSAWAPTPSSDDSQYPIQYKIDYIRAYQRAEYNGNGLYPDQ